jgi:hypothetical protein
VGVVVRLLGSLLLILYRQPMPGVGIWRHGGPLSERHALVVALQRQNVERNKILRRAGPRQ